MVIEVVSSNRGGLIHTVYVYMYVFFFLGGGGGGGSLWLDVVYCFQVDGLISGGGGGGRGVITGILQYRF